MTGFLKSEQNSALILPVSCISFMWARYPGNRQGRKEQQITQAEIATRTGINQGDISRLERGTRNPSLNMLKKFASGLGMQLKIEFLPKAQQT